MSNRQVSGSKKTYRRILALDKYNTVARKNLEKIGSLCASDPISSQKSSCPHRLTPDTFLEEPGKTKTVLLKNVAPSAVISLLRIGEPVLLHAKKHSIDVRTEDKTYIGALPDDIAFRMLRFLKSGNVYSICIKNIQKNSISVFIRETHRGKRFSCQPTFLPTAAEFTPSILKQIDVSES